MARRKLTKKQKIAIGVGVAAVAGITAAVLMRRRQETPGSGSEIPPVIVGYVPQVPGLATAKRRLCLNPTKLTEAQMGLIIDHVIIPIMEGLGHEASGTSAQQHEAFYDAVSDTVVDQLCPAGPHAASREVARTLTYGAWLKWNGLSGQ